MKKTVFAVCLAILTEGTAGAIGLATSFGEVFVSNIPLGSTISLREMTGAVYRVTNTSLSPSEISMTVKAPEEADTLKPGYEPIPDIGWVTLSENNAYLAANQEKVADVLFNIPKDEKYVDKKYQFHILAAQKTAGTSMLAVAIKSRLLIHTAPSLETIVERKEAKQIIDQINFYLMPASIQLEDFPLGKKVQVKAEFKKAFKIINVSDKPMNIEIESIRRAISGISAMPDVEDGQPSLVEPEVKELTIEENAIGVIPFSIHIPDEEQYRGKSYFFVIRASLKGYAVPISAYGRIVVTTKGGKKPEAKTENKEKLK